MAPYQDRLTLDALLSDPLTQLVMRSDGITSADVAQAFAMARVGLAEQPQPARRLGLCTTFDRWIGQGASCWMG
jgi:hypothetical protein